MVKKWKALKEKMSKKSKKTVNKKVKTTLSSLLLPLLERDGSENAVADLMAESLEKYEKDANDFWSGLSYEEKLMAFYAVCKKIHDGDLMKRGSYRHVLYDVFGFKPDAYSLGIHCGYMNIHNSMVPVSDQNKEQEITNAAKKVLDSDYFEKIMSGRGEHKVNVAALKLVYAEWKSVSKK
jgi:hypothetical protein